MLIGWSKILSHGGNLDNQSREILLSRLWSRSAAPRIGRCEPRSCTSTLDDLSMMNLINQVRSSLIFRSSSFFSVLPLFKRREAARTLEQEALFLNYGLSRSVGMQLLDDLCIAEFGCLYSENKGMWSEHLVFFASLAGSGRAPRKILEIGTFRGETTLFLSRLFPESEIVSVDLPMELARQMSLYDYGKDDTTVKVRTKNLHKTKNVTLLEASSVTLLLAHEEFDLIWLDGAHGYPVVALDIANSFRMISSDGLVICDDVYKRLRRNDAIYDSDATFATLSELESTGLIQCTYLMKRIGARFQVYPRLTKEIAVFRKIAKSDQDEFSWRTLQ
jgi:predicted O-methyltransferase YrrM